MSKRKLLLRLIDFAIIIGVYTFITILADKSALINIALGKAVIAAAVLLLCYYAVFEVFRIYKPIWRYAVYHDYLRLLTACALAGFIASLAAVTILDLRRELLTFVMSAALSALLLISIRLVYNTGAGSRQMYYKPDNPTLIIGAGWPAKNILSELKGPLSRYSPIGLVDDRTEMLHRTIDGIPVLGTSEDIPDICAHYKVRTIIFAIPDCDDYNKRRILNICFKCGCDLKTLPDINDILSGAKDFNNIEKVKIEDLLGRESAKFDDKDIRALIKDKVCLVTGGGGSIGSELCRQIAAFSPKKLLIIDNYENNAYDIQQELIHKYGAALDLVVEIFSITDKKRLEIFFDFYNPQLVFHAAAHKHVPLMENTPEQAVKNNVEGTLIVAQTAANHGAQKFILISTDKAVRPTNIMGATKRVAEKVVRMTGESSSTVFASVRFGNVLGSNGSVIPLFKKQIEQGGPITVTDENVVRYFMTIKEAALLVLQAGAQALGGEVFVLDMGKPIKILDLAQKMIKLAGYEPYKDIDIRIIGLRPGEKLFEELLLESEGLKTTPNKKIFIGTQKSIDLTKFKENLTNLIEAAHNNDKDAVVERLKHIVTSFAHKANN
jgi:FlaA1/EpsC-like NDP-sugar epimerase